MCTISNNIHVHVVGTNLTKNSANKKRMSEIEQVTKPLRRSQRLKKRVQVSMEEPSSNLGDDICGGKEKDEDYKIEEMLESK